MTPHITDKDIITLHIHPVVSDVQDDNKVFTLGGQVQSIPLAKSSVRESDSMVRAKSGEMVIIGGLMQNNTQSLTQGIPYLKDIPYLGNVFKHTVQKTTKSELVILLRPTVIDDKEKAWNNHIDSTNDRINKMDDTILLDESRYLLKNTPCKNFDWDDCNEANDP